MKKSHILLLSVPVIAGAIYLRSLASWRPQKVFGGKGEIQHLVFSKDGKTLLVAQGPSDIPTKLIALDATRSFAPKWSYSDGSELGKPQFYLSDSRVLVDRDHIRLLDANTGQERRKFGTLRKAAMSPDGKWLVYNGAQPTGATCTPSFTISPSDLFIESSIQQVGAMGKRIRGGNILAQHFFFSPDTQTFIVRVLAANEKGRSTRLDFYNVKTWKRTSTWLDAKDQPNLYGGPAYLSRNGRFLLSASNSDNRDGQPAEVKISLWNVRDGKRLSSMVIPCNREPYGFGSRMVTPTFEVQNDGRVLRFGANGPVSLSKSTNLSAGFEQLLSLPFDTTTTATLSPDGSYLVAGTKSGRVIWKRVK